MGVGDSGIPVPSQLNIWHGLSMRLFLSQCAPECHITCPKHWDYWLFPVQNTGACHGVKYLPGRLSPETLYFRLTCPQDTLLQSKLSPEQFTLEKSVPLGQHSLEQVIPPKVNRHPSS